MIRLLGLSVATAPNIMRGARIIEPRIKKPPMTNFRKRISALSLTPIITRGVNHNRTEVGLPWRKGLVSPYLILVRDEADEAEHLVARVDKAVLLTGVSLESFLTTPRPDRINTSCSQGWEWSGVELPGSTSKTRMQKLGAPSRAVITSRFNTPVSSWMGLVSV
jgi:hypothetical protein